jgi:hypothetical protein
MDFSIFEPILALRDELLEHLNDLAAPAAAKAGDGPATEGKDQAAAGLLRRVFEERDRALAALAASKPGSAVEIKDILRAASAPLPPVEAPLPSPLGGPARARAAKKPVAKKPGPRKA